MARIIFFETYSPLLVISALGAVRQADTIYFHEKLYPVLPTAPLHSVAKRAVSFLLRIMGAAGKVKPLPDDWIRKRNWEANREALRITGNLADTIKAMRLFRSMFSVVGSRQLVRFYQFRHVNWLAGRIFFWDMCRMLAAENGSANCVFIPKTPNRFNDPGGIKELLDRIPSAVEWVNSCWHHCCRLLALLMLLVCPLGYILPRLRRLRFASGHRRDLKTYKVMMPLLYGFFDVNERIVRHGVKRSNDDGMLYNEKLPKGSIVHLFGMWHKPEEEERKIKKVMEAAGLAYADMEDFVLSPAFLSRWFSVQVGMVRLFLASLFQTDEDFEFYYSTLFAVKAILDKFVELDNLDYKVEFVRNDYNPIHIIRTILNQKRNIVSVGIQHHINGIDFPPLCFAYFDKYIVYGDLVVNSFMPYWKELELCKTGRENIDYVVETLREEEHLAEIRVKMDRLHGKRKHTVLFTLPSGNPLNEKKQWQQFYDGLVRVLATDLDFRAFLRFRSTVDFERHDHCRRVAELAAQDDRFILDHENFTTHELMAVADLVIANSVSFSIWEALVAGAVVFSFDFIGVAGYYFPHYGKDFILRTPEQLVKVFENLVNGYENYDVDWQKLAADCNYFVDGRNHERIQGVVNSAVVEANEMFAVASRCAWP